MIHAWTVVYGLLALGWGLDGLRLRRRAQALAVLQDSEEPVSPSHRFVTRTGVLVDEPTRRAASAFARQHGLRVVDLVPRDLPVRRATLLLQLVDLVRYRADPLAVGASAGEAMLIDADVLERMRVSDTLVEDVLALTELGRRVKLYASTETDFAVAPRMRTAREDRPRRRALLRFGLGDLAPGVLLVQAALALLGPLLSHVAGGIALGAMHVQPLLATVGTPLRPRGLFVFVLFRTLRDIAAMLDPFAPPRRNRVAVLAEQLRPAYAKLLQPGLERFFEPRREDCPMCDARSLGVKMTVPDRMQHKPGRFTVEQCRDCGHVFQNPRLSIEGLDFYYKDFYDGLGEGELEKLFRSSLGPYRARAKMVRALVEPAHWLDVGAGHGHFCMIARQEWPKTVFDGVDLADSVEDAVRRGWITHGYRALFPEIAGELAGKYDVVSMSHYLEHTRDPRAEIEAAAKVVRTGGALLVEVPDPESVMGRLLGSWWFSWFQPQHQHFVSAGRLEEILRGSGFEPTVWHRGEAHFPCDFVLAAGLLIGRLAQPLGKPWLAPTGAVALVRHVICWTLALPFLLLATVLDHALAPFLRSPGLANTYRVLARRL